MALVILLSANSQAEAAQTQKITFWNWTGRPITVLRCWSGDVDPSNLLSKPLQNGTSIDTWGDPAWMARRNVTIGFSDGQSFDWINRNFTNVSYVKFYRGNDGGIKMTYN